MVRATSSAQGLLRVRLKSRGDWDLGVFDAKTKRYVAGSAAFRGNELAEGFVTKGQRLLVQACRFRGRSSSARVSISFLAAPPATVSGPTQVVDVSTPTRADKERLQRLGLDLTEHGDADSIEVVLYGDADAAVLRRNKFRYSVRIADLAQRNEANRRADRRYRTRVAQTGSALPSGRTTYRRLPDYEFEMKLLARRYPNLVKPLTLPHRTHLGRDVQGIEIANNPYNLRDGKPIFLQLGVHHAREWPSSEHALEWAYDLITNYGNAARTTRLVRATRNIVVPIVNPDGFNISREAPAGPAEDDFGTVRLRDEAQELLAQPDGDRPEPNGAVREQLRWPAARRRPQPQLRRTSGAVGERAWTRWTTRSAEPCRSRSRRRRTSASSTPSVRSPT